MSIGAVVVDIDDGDADHFLTQLPPVVYVQEQDGRPVSMPTTRHEGGRIRPRPFNAPLFRIAGDLKHARSYVVLYDAPRLANDITNGSLGVPFIELLKAIVTGPPAAQGGQRGPLTPPVGSNANPGDSTASPWHNRHDWILGKLTAARVDGMDPKAIHRYAVELHGALFQPPDDVPHYFPRSEALSIADFVSARSYSAEHQRAAGIRSGQARRARSAPRDKRILGLLNTGLSIRRTAARLGLSRQVVQKAKDRQRAWHGG